MGILVLIIVVSIIVAACRNSNSSNAYRNNPNLTLDVARMYQDSIDVTLGNLSESEKKRRMKSGYYMVQKGQEYDWFEERRKKRIQRWKDQGYL